MRRFSKRLLIVLLGIAIAMVGITVTDSAPSSAYIREYQHKYGYRSLSTPLQTCYGAIYTTLTDGFDSDESVSYGDEDTYCGAQISLPAVIRAFDDVQTLFTAFTRDNPHFFYIDNRYSSRHITAFGQTVYTHISLLYTMDAAERRTARERLDAVVEDMVKDLPDTKDEFIKELRLHDALLRGCTYDQEAADADGDAANENVYSAYGALVEGRAVCEGYARAMQLLLDRAGINNHLISGKSIDNGEGHIWNLVTINGNQYHLDPTWNDVGHIPQHIYFNCTTAQLQRTHKIDSRYASIVCGAVKDNYHIRNNLYLATSDREAIIDVIADQLKNYSESIEIRFAPHAYEEAQLFLRDGKLTRELVNLEIYFTEHILWRYVLYSHDESHVLCMQKKT